MTGGVAERTDVTRDAALPVYSRAALRHVAMPLGGIGAGQIALGGDGGLRQWQIHNQVNHLGFVPDSFFAILASAVEPPLDVLRILQSREAIERADDPTPLVTDDRIPPDQRDLLQRFTGVERTTFRGPYPIARVAYEDDALPLDIELEAFSPYVPLDSGQSGYPAIVFNFSLRSRWRHDLHGCLAASLQNAVGWDGVTPISGNRCPLYGGNINKLRRGNGRTEIVMENPALPDDHPGAGQMVLAALSDTARSHERWSTPAHLIRFIEGFHAARYLGGANQASGPGYRNDPVTPHGPSPAGETWNSGLLVPFRLRPGETTRVTFVYAWYFPNRYVNFDQFGPRRDYGRSRFWLGNHYATRFADAVDVVDQVLRAEPSQATRAWEGVVQDSTLPGWLSEAIAAQGSLIRSPTCFRTGDGRFFGFEGSLGASTAMWNGTYGGSCPLNCTHVWNYEMALSRLFPELERTMRETELEVMQAPEGYIPHRAIAPLYLRQLWDEPIGGPTNPALDGMLGTVLKFYREVRLSGDVDWLQRHWPRIEQLMNYIAAKWDAGGDGVLEGEQPNTYDIAFYGANIYIGGLWLAALRAAEELAKLAGAGDLAARWRQRFELGRDRYDQLLWNGEYYRQLLDESIPVADQFGDGCLADQLLGQWWAHLLDLGYILPEDHVKTTLRSIVRHNLRRGFDGFDHDYRVFADRDDAGLLVCTWPRGGRPEVPVRYCDEVWTGIEYQVAAHCIMEGLVDEGMEVLAALRGRYDGRRRNPYNEIECGDHYARAMAGWAVLEALTGQRTDATRYAVHVAPAGNPDHLRAPFVADAGWGSVEWTTDGQTRRLELSLVHGSIELSELSIGTTRNETGTAVVWLDDTALEADQAHEEDRLVLTFADRLALHPGQRLRVETRSG